MERKIPEFYIVNLAYDNYCTGCNKIYPKELTQYRFLNGTQWVKLLNLLKMVSKCLMVDILTNRFKSKLALFTNKICQ